MDVTSHPDKIHDALAASVSVLRDVRVSPINKRELSRAKITLLTRHEADLKDNEYWLGLMTHVQVRAGHRAAGRRPRHALAACPGGRKRLRLVFCRVSAGSGLCHADVVGKETRAGLRAVRGPDRTLARRLHSCARHRGVRCIRGDQGSCVLCHGCE